jgi:hypothetical protein
MGKLSKRKMAELKLIAALTEEATLAAEEKISKLRARQAARAAG